MIGGGWNVRALARAPDGQNAQDLARQGVQVMQGDLGDEASIRRAMAGVYGVFSVQPSSGQGAAYNVTDEDEVRYGQTVARIALESGVRHLVYSSVNAAGPAKTGMGHFDSKAEIETYIRGLGLNATIVRPAAFMELLMLPGMGLDQGAFTFFLRPEQTGQFMAVRDIGVIVAAIFADHDRFVGRTIEIASDQVTGNELARKLTGTAGKPIKYQRFPDELLAETPFLGKLAALVDDGRLAGNAGLEALRHEFGPLTTFDAWLSGPGKALLAAAMHADHADMALRQVPCPGIRWSRAAPCAPVSGSCDWCLIGIATCLSRPASGPSDYDHVVISGAWLCQGSKDRIWYGGTRWGKDDSGAV